MYTSLVSYLVCFLIINTFISVLWVSLHTLKFMNFQFDAFVKIYRIYNQNDHDNDKNISFNCQQFPPFPLQYILPLNLRPLQPMICFMSL